jgi:hypothetical protein
MVYLPDNVKVPLSEFLFEYVKLPEHPNMEIMPDHIIQQSIKFLIKEGVFTEDELREELLKSKGIIVPIKDLYQF